MNIGVQRVAGVVPLLNNQAYWFITVPAKKGILNIKHLVNRIYKHILIIFQMKYDKYLISKSETGILLNDIYDMKTF